jgi:O-antigen/teichoic acid export membrane protein
VTLAHRAVRGTAILLVSSYANLAFGFITTTALMRLLSTEVFGLFAIASLFFSVLDPRNKLGLDYALIHHQPQTDEVAATHWILQVMLSIITLILGLAAAWLLPQAGYPSAMAPILIALCIIGIIEAAGTTARALLEKNLRLGRSSIIVSGGLFFGNAAAILLAWLGAGVWSLVAQVGVNTIISSIGFWWLTPVRPELRFAPGIARWMLRFGSTLIIGSLATVVLLQGDNYMVATFVGVTAAGYYVQAYKIAQWPTGLVTHVVSRAALSTYAALQNDVPRLSKAFDLTLWVIVSVATPLALALFVTAPDFVVLFFGEKWLPSAWLLQALVGYSVLRPLLDDTGALFVATGRPHRVTQLLLSQAVTLVAIALPLTIMFGAMGTAIGVGFTFVVGIIIAYRFVGEYVTLKWRSVFGPPLTGLITALVINAVIGLTFNMDSVPLIMRIVVRSSIAVATFGTILLILQRQSLNRLRYINGLLRSV